MAALLMYHQRLPSPAPIFVSHDAPSKSLLSLRMVNGMVPVSPTGTSASLPNIEVTGTTYRTCDCMRRSNIIFESHLSNQAAKAENLISILCNLNSISDPEPISKLCNLDTISVLSRISNLQIYPVAEVQSTPPVLSQRHTSASSSQRLCLTRPETTEELCRTRHCPYGAQRPRVKFLAGV